MWEKAEESNRASDEPENRVEKKSQQIFTAKQCKRPTVRMEGTITVWSQRTHESDQPGTPFKIEPNPDLASRIKIDKDKGNRDNGEPQKEI